MRLNEIKNISRDDVLAALGLQVRPSALGAVLTSIGLLGIGALLGAGAALLLAPKSGRELRGDLGSRINGATRRINESVRREAAERM
jgi:hypothetical protein